MLCLTCTTITSVELAYYGVSRLKDWVFVDCGTSRYNHIHEVNILIHIKISGYTAYTGCKERIEWTRFIKAKYILYRLST